MAASFAPVSEALDQLRAGRMVIVCDDADHANQGDLVLAAQFATDRSINFMVSRARGLVCLALTGEGCDRLGLPPMTRKNRSRRETAFTVSIEARDGVSTGISAADRARTIQAAIHPASGPQDLVRPGHVFPLRARDGGVLVRSGHTEAGVDLVRLAGLTPAAVVCEILNDDGTISRLGNLGGFAARHDLPLVSVADLIAYRHRTERLIERVAEAHLPTDHGSFQMVGFRSLPDEREHLALVRGDLEAFEQPLVRVHSGCVTGEAFGSLRCDCADQLDEAMRRIDEEGAGAIVYLAQEGRGLGLLDKLRAYELQDDQGLDTVDANLALGFPPDLRHFGIGAQILSDLGLRAIRLMTNNPKKIVGLSGYGIEVIDQVPIQPPVRAENSDYLWTKASRLGHTLQMASGPPVSNSTDVETPVPEVGV
ncbi:bifunctional 3,4-dihydroxy-2-butanone-4-phosphate synthase/GTP cyclohydrolase II [Thermoleophilia bacterium SCSIO 60948]|nr:bifunctional 3,4-dihydroxy-2-butanone-4-phosphate synthase/GTP cyclohydrolase II [Thermoleophilia bacterium SCSIO 60948]